MGDRAAALVLTDLSRTLSLRSALTDRGTLVAAAVGCLLALVASLPGLGARDLWLDEAFTVTSTNQLWESLGDRAGSMGLYYVAMTPWASISTDPAWVRLPSALFAALAVGLTVVLAARILGRPVAWHVALIMPLLWGVTRYGQEARSYALLMLLVVASWHLLISAARADRSSRRHWTLLGVVHAAALYAHPFAVLTLFAQVIWAMGPDIQHHWRRRDVITGGAVLGLLAAPLVVLTATSSSASPSWIPPLELAQVARVLEMIAGPSALSRSIVVIAVVVATGSLVAVALARPASERWPLTAVLAWVWIPPLALVLVSLGMPAMLGRFLTASLPAVALLLGAALVAIGPVLARRGALVAILVLLVAGQAELQTDPGHAWSDAVELAGDAVSRDDTAVVVFADPMFRQPFELAAGASWLAGGPPVLSPTDPWGSNLRYADELAPSTIAERITSSERVVLVFQELPIETIRSEASRALIDLLDQEGHCLVEETVLSGGVTVTELARCAPE